MEKISYIYIKSTLSLQGVAEQIRRIINASTTNSFTKGPQRRYGENFGGEYFLIECFGLEINILKNKGEVEIEEYPDYQYYLVISFIKDLGVPISSISNILYKVLREDGVEVSNGE